MMRFPTPEIVHCLLNIHYFGVVPGVSKASRFAGCLRKASWDMDLRLIATMKMYRVWLVAFVFWRA
jgi:hypothetical protein